MQALETTGQLDNTLVIFIGDNGPPLPRAKTTSWEAGVAVPLIIRPVDGADFAARHTTKLTSALDLFPTVLEAAGIPVPDQNEGRSLLPLLDSDEAVWRQYLFTEMNFHSPKSFIPWRTVRDDRFKLHWRADAQGEESYQLYDLESDPMETVNLIGVAKWQAVETRLRDALSNWRQATNDPLLDSEVILALEAKSEDWRASDNMIPEQDTFLDDFLENKISGSR